MDVSDRSLQAKLTQEAKITSASFLSEVIFAFGGFINALGRPPIWGGRPLCRQSNSVSGTVCCGCRSRGSVVRKGVGEGVGVAFAS